MRSRSLGRRGWTICPLERWFARRPSLATDLALSYNLPGMAVAEKRSLPPDRPRSVTLVAWGVFFLGTVNLWRAFGFARQSDLYENLGIRPGPWILLASALVWAALLLAAALAVWYRWPPVRFALPLLMGLYGLYQLGFQALFTKTKIAYQGRAGFALLYGAVVLLTFWALNRRMGQLYLVGEEED